MSSDLLIWLIPAYLIHIIFQLVRPTRNRSGWDFLGQLSLFALTSYLSAVLLSAWLQRLDWGCLLSLRDWWKATFPTPGSGRFLLSLFLACPTGVLFAIFWKYCLLRLTGKFTESVNGRKRDIEFTDVFFSTMATVLSKPILVSLSSRKVYIGILIEATDDPNETLRFIKIAPIMSGYRDADNFRLTIDTDYIGSQKSAEAVPNRDILIPVSQISTLAPFDVQMHNQFVAAGRTKIEQFEGTKSSVAT